MTDAKTLWPERSAHATIQGFLYQAYATVVTWLTLDDEAVIFCEGDEDLDTLRDGGLSISVQFKDRKALETREVTTALRNFMTAYHGVTVERGEARAFVFQTTAVNIPETTRKALAGWAEPEVRETFIAKVRATSAEETKDKDTNGAQLERAALAWFDEDAARWQPLFDAVTWILDAPSLEQVRGQALEILEARADTKDLGPTSRAAVFDQLVVRVLDASRAPEAKERLLKRQQLEDLLQGQDNWLAGWMADKARLRLLEIEGEAKEAERITYVLDPGTRVGKAKTPGQLLTAGYEVVPFESEGRQDALDDLEAWCRTDAPSAVRLLYGEGGMGKTRLLIEVCHRLRTSGWHAGFLKRDVEADKLREQLLSGSAPRVIVVDYAETRLATVDRVLRVLGDHPGPAARLVLLARRGGDWWDNLPKGACEPVRALLAQSPPARSIEALVPEPEQRRGYFDRAFGVFASAIDSVVPPPGELAALKHDDFGRVLYIYAAALAAAFGEEVVDAAGVLDSVLAHERAFWCDEDDHGDARADKVATAERLMTVATLAGGFPSKGDATRLAPKFGALSKAARQALARRIERLYSGPKTSVAGLEPDMLGEHLVAQTLAAAEEADARQLLVRACKLNGKRTLSLLTRLAHRPPEEYRWLESAIASDLRKLGPVAVEVAATTGDPAGKALASVLQREGDATAAESIVDLCAEDHYRDVIYLKEVAAEAELVSYRHHQASYPDADEAQLDERARRASNVGYRLHAMGRRDEALKATQHAVDIRRKLSQSRPEVFLPVLAQSLSNLGAQLDAVGEIDEALEATQQAVEIYRRLVESRPEVFLPDLAQSLNNLGVQLGAVGRNDDALEVMRQCVDIRRELAQSRSESALSDLALSLNNLGGDLDAVGRKDDALEVTQEAVNIYRQLAQSRPEVFLPDLAGSLNNLGNHLDAVGRKDEALEVTQEAVDIRRKLAQSRPEVFLPDLAGSLNNLGNLLAAVGRKDEALGVTREAVDGYRQLAQSRPEVFLPDLATSLNSLGNRLDAVGRKDDALEMTQEAVDIRRELATSRPEVFLPDLAMSLNNLGIRLAAEGRKDEALNAAQEAVDSYRQLAQSRPEAFLPDLAMSVSILSDVLWAVSACIG